MIHRAGIAAWFHAAAPAQSEPVATGRQLVVDLAVVLIVGLAVRLALYQRPQAATVLAHSRRVMEAIRSGMAISAFQAWQQVSTIAS
jgi:ethanolamine ammonia-lyase large subunit